MIKEYIEYGAYGYTNEYRTEAKCNNCQCVMDIQGKQKAAWQYLSSLGWIQIDDKVFCPDCIPSNILYYSILDKDGNEKEKGCMLIHKTYYLASTQYNFDRPVHLEPGETLNVQYTNPVKTCKFDHIGNKDG